MEGFRQYFLTKRWQLSYIVFFGVFSLYILRVNISVAVVCMVNGTSNNHHSDHNSSQHSTEEFDWSSSTRSNLLSSYFYGYLILQIPGGWAADRFGATKVITFTMLFSSLATLLTPVCARAGLPWVFAVRVFIGLCASVTFPSFQSLWGRWAPAHERSQLVALAFSGGYFGSIVSFSMSGYLCQHGFAGGWPSIFYSSGGVAMLWTLLWYVLVYDTPSKHPTINEEEREYIIKSLDEHTQRHLPVPWPVVLTSLPVWSLIAAIVAVSWVDYTFLMTLPQYMKDVLDYDITQNGILSSVPPLCQLVSALLSGKMADWICAKGLSTRLVRNLFQITQFVGISGCLLGVGYVDKQHRSIAVVLLGLSGFFDGLQQAGYLANYIDIAPRFVGVLYGIGNCIATVSGIGAPLLVGAITKQKSQEEWQDVFNICVGVSMLAALIFLIFSRGEVQPWAVDTNEETMPINDPDHEVPPNMINTTIQDCGIGCNDE